MNTEKSRLKFITTLSPKSNIQASLGKNSGKYPFFTSSKVQNKFLDQYQFDSENIIMGTGGVASVHYYNGKFSVSTDCIVLKIDNSYSTKFVYYFLKSKQKLIDDLGFEGSGLKHLQKDFLFNLNINLIPLDKQNLIVKFLDEKTSKINKLIEKNQKLIELLEEKKISLVNQVVTKGINPNVEMKDSGIEWIGEIPKKWKISPLKRCCYVTKLAGFEFTKYMDYIPYGEIIALRGLNIKNHELNLDNIVRISKEVSDFLVRSKLDEGDLIFSYVGTIGEVALISKSDIFHLAPNVAKIKNIKKNELNSIYLLYYLISDSGHTEILSNTSKTTQEVISMSKIRNLSIIIPPIYEQNKIVNFLINNEQKINKIMKKIQKQNELLEEYKQSLIYNVVTGKVKVEE